MNAPHRRRPVEFLEPPGLPGWLAKQLPWRRRVARIGEHRIHFIDHQEHRDHAVLLMHGHPTWSYLWRHVIQRLSGQPFRVIAPDLVGLGLSSKPTDMAFHSLANHIELQTALIRALNVERLTIVGQDWGGPVVTGVGYNLSDRVHSMVLANTAVVAPRHYKTTAFHRLSHMPVVSDILMRGLGVPIPMLWAAQGDRRSIGPRQLRAYAYPYWRLRDRAALLAMPRMVPNSADHPTTGILQTVGPWVEAFRKPASLVWGINDPILGRALENTSAALPHAEVHKTQAGHFLQEEVPDLLAAEIVRVASL